MSAPTPIDRERRVTYVITSSGIGGAETQVRNLAISMRARGWRVAVVSMLPVAAEMQGLAEHGVQLRDLGMPKGAPDPRGLRRLIGILRGSRSDIVHSHMVHANLLVRLARPFASIPGLISTIHNQDEGHQWRYLAYRATDRLADLTTTVSQDALSEAVRRHAVPRERIVLVPNGVRTATYRTNPGIRRNTRDWLDAGDDFIWLAAGRLTDAKDYPMMLRAFEMATAEPPPSRLWIAGEGPARDAIARDIAELGLGDRVETLGPRDDVRDLMQAADGFLLSSAWEGLPMVLLEAGASSLPIAATSVGGTAEAVVDGASGYLSPPGDAQRLAASMQQIMSMGSDERLAMGEAGRVHAQANFDLDTVADRWLSIYGSLIDEAAP